VGPNSARGPGPLQVKGQDLGLTYDVPVKKWWLIGMGVALTATATLSRLVTRPDEKSSVFTNPVSAVLSVCHAQIVSFHSGGIGIVHVNPSVVSWKRQGDTEERTALVKRTSAGNYRVVDCNATTIK
jgi:hypothetical protein